MNHIPDTTKMVKLTLDQLREMDGGQPVFVECLEKKELSGLGYTIDGGVDSYHTTRFYDTYEKDWIAYAYQPANIDREAWEPCEECRKRNCDTCLYSDYLSNMEPCKSCCNAKEWKPMYNFCCECGRPLTPEARAMLEKRLRG